MSLRLSVTTAFAFLVIACGGGGSSSRPAIGVQPQQPLPAPAPLLAVDRIFAGVAFQSPVAIRQAPGDVSRWYVVEQGGIIHAFDNDPAVGTTDTYLDLSAVINDSFGEAGLLSLAFHPNYPATPDIFVLYTATGAPLITIVSRFTLVAGGTTIDPASEQVLFSVPQPQSNHNGGDLAFASDGLLHASLGDGGGSGDPGENAQNSQNLLGSIVRIDVDGALPYEIPADNPFFGNALCTSGPSGGADCPEIFAWGFRNPWRISFDTITGELWTGDVGQGDWEEVDLVRLGLNYGWNDREGAHCFDPLTGCADIFEEPISEYDHSLGQSVTGGYVYRGVLIPNLVGWYVFGDFVTGVLFAVEADSPATTTPDELGDAGFNISSFGEDADGELYVVDYGGGGIYQIVEAP